MRIEEPGQDLPRVVFEAAVGIGDDCATRRHLDVARQVVHGLLFGFRQQPVHGLPLLVLVFAHRYSPPILRMATRSFSRSILVEFAPTSCVPFSDAGFVHYSCAIHALWLRAGRIGPTGPHRY